MMLCIVTCFVFNKETGGKTSSKSENIDKGKVLLRCRLRKTMVKYLLSMVVCFVDTLLKFPTICHRPDELGSKTFHRSYLIILPASNTTVVHLCIGGMTDAGFPNNKKSRHSGLLFLLYLFLLTQRWITFLFLISCTFVLAFCSSSIFFCRRSKVISLSGIPFSPFAVSSFCRSFSFTIASL